MSGSADTVEIIAEAFHPIAGRRLLDVGCGAGALAASLAARGAQVTGVDPSETALAKACRAVHEAAFEAADARALPFADGAFDGAVIHNALHHVPEDGMVAALREAARVTGPSRGVVVVEPLARGNYFALTRLVEDETEVRARAQEALAAAVADGLFAVTTDLEYDRPQRFDDLDAYLARTVGVDPGRAERFAARRPEIEATFHARSRRDEAGRFVLEQPLRAVVLRVR